MALGIGMGNLELLLLSSFPLLLLAVSLASRPRGAVAASRSLSTTAPRRGDAIDVLLSVRGAEPSTLVEVHAPLPGSMKIEAGSNLALATGEGTTATSMRARAHARGRQELGAVTVEALDPVGIAAPIKTEAAPPVTIEVAPRSHNVQKVRGKARAKQQAEVEEARLGVDSTDFRELREYAWGDPPNAINWKATARRLSALGRHGGRQTQPIVNEYEKEGKRTVFVLLDGGPALRVGTTLESGLDHGVEGAVAVARFFLARGARVGAWTYGCKRAGPLAAPEAGSGQAPGIERALAPSDELEGGVALPLALRQVGKYLAGTKPLVVVVTRVTPRNVSELAEGAKRLRAYLEERRRALPLVVLDVRALSLAPAPTPAWQAAREMTELEDEKAARVLSGVGVRVLAWRPGEEALRQALYRGGFA